LITKFRTHFARAEMIDDDACADGDLSGLELILHQTRAGEFGDGDEIGRRSDLRHRRIERADGVFRLDRDAGDRGELIFGRGGGW
jgi:hypothetical protein